MPAEAKRLAQGSFIPISPDGRAQSFAHGDAQARMSELIGPGKHDQLLIGGAGAAQIYPVELGLIFKPSVRPKTQG